MTRVRCDGRGPHPRTRQEEMLRNRSGNRVCSAPMIGRGETGPWPGQVAKRAGSGSGATWNVGVLRLHMEE